MIKCAFSDEDFDKADHIGEIRRRPSWLGAQWTPAEIAAFQANKSNKPFETNKINKTPQEEK